MKSTIIEADNALEDDDNSKTRAYGGGNNHEDSTCIRPRIYQVAGCTGKYTDLVSASIQSVKRVLLSPKSKRNGPRGGVSEPFPYKLYEMLVGLESENNSCVAAWSDHGRCFEIVNPVVFAEDVMPRYFKQSKLTSFHRQLNLYGFQRVASGVDKGCFYHPLFLRGRPDLCRIMLRTRVKGNYGIMTRESDQKMDCNSFHDLPRCPPADPAPDEIEFPLDGQYDATLVDINEEEEEDGVHHHSISLPSSPQPADDARQHSAQCASCLAIPLPQLPPFTLPAVPALNSSDSCLDAKQRRQTSVEPPMERTPRGYDYVLSSVEESEDAPPSAVQSMSTTTDSSFAPEDYACCSPINHFAVTSSSYYAVVSPTYIESMSCDSNNTEDDWFTAPLPADVSLLPEDDDGDYDDPDPIWGRTFQCMDEDGMQAYERSIERRYRPCKP